MEIRTSLPELRAKRGLGAAQLATMVGVSRQTIYAIEAGTYIPNTAVSLKLAQALDTTVEEMFQIDASNKAADEVLEVKILNQRQSVVPGQPLRLCAVDAHPIAVAPELSGFGLPLADAVLLERGRKGGDGSTARVRQLSNQWKRTPRLLVAGCDPSASILAQALLKQGCELVIAYENSSRALKLLYEGLVHIAGTHIVDKATGKADLLPLTREFGRKSLAIVSYAIWQEGLVVARGNPKRITGISDLARKDVRFMNREAGAGCRLLLDELLAEQGIASKQVHGYENVAAGHLPAARGVHTGEADCCISTQAVARALALDFIPLTEKPYYLVMRRAQLNHPGVQQMLDILGRAAFRREVESCTGYDMRHAGDRVI